MATALSAAAPAATAHDARAALRGVTVAVGITAAAWHASNAAAIPVASAGLLATAVAVVVLHLAWLTWLIRRPSLACLVWGAGALGAGLLATMVLLWLQSRTALGVGFAAGVGVAIQLSLLVTVVAGAVRAVPDRACRAACGLGLACTALALCVTVAGGDHGHSSAAPSSAGIFAPAAAPTTTELLCRLV